MAPRVQRSISIKELRAECQLLERVVSSERLATKEQFVEQRPGGRANPDKTARGWLYFYRWLHRQHAKLEHRAGETPARALADATVMDALRADPVAVTILGRPEPLHVYPKSLDALLQVHALDRQLAWLNTQLSRLYEAATPSALELVPRLLEEISYTYHLLAWIVTTDGPKMPYRPDDPAPQPPDWITTLEPWDIVRIVEAHHKHLFRLQALSALVDERRQGEQGGQCPSWSMFIGSMALELGADPVVLMRDRDLVSMLAAVQLRNAAQAPAEKPAAPLAAGSGREAF